MKYLLCRATANFLKIVLRHLIFQDQSLITVVRVLGTESTRLIISALIFCIASISVYFSFHCVDYNFRIHHHSLCCTNKAPGKMKS